MSVDLARECPAFGLAVIGAEPAGEWDQADVSAWSCDLEPVAGEVAADFSGAQSAVGHELHHEADISRCLLHGFKDHVVFGWSWE